VFGFSLGVPKAIVWKKATRDKLLDKPWFEFFSKGNSNMHGIVGKN
jgi:hypothetical protein